MLEMLIGGTLGQINADLTRLPFDLFYFVFVGGRDDMFWGDLRYPMGHPASAQTTNDLLSNDIDTPITRLYAATDIQNLRGENIVLIYAIVGCI